jgi:HAD superfamily hydrolase (TIGR01549 family)
LGERALPAELKAIVFDVDGTLYHLEGIRKALWIHFLRCYWYRPMRMRRVMRAVRSYGLAPESLRSVPAEYSDLEDAHRDCAVKACGLPRDFVLESARQWLVEEPIAFISNYRHEGVQDVLSELAGKGVRLGVFSDYPPRAKLRAMGIENFFEAVVSAQDPEVQRFKPDPLGIQVTLRRMRIAANQALYVGDRPEIDGVAAERAGVAFRLVGDNGANGATSFRELGNLMLSHLEKHRRTRI